MSFLRTTVNAEYEGLPTPVSVSIGRIGLFYLSLGLFGALATVVVCFVWLFPIEAVAIIAILGAFAFCFWAIDRVNLRKQRVEEQFWSGTRHRLFAQIRGDHVQQHAFYVRDDTRNRRSPSEPAHPQHSLSESWWRLVRFITSPWGNP